MVGPIISNIYLAPGLRRVKINMAARVTNTSLIFPKVGEV